MRTQPIVTASVVALAFSLAGMAGTYRDPQQRFEINVPAGWTAEPFGEGVQIKRGGAYCVVMEGQAETPQALVSHLVGQIGGQWTSFQELKKGSVTVSGTAAPYSLNSGVNKGVASYLKVTAVAAGGRTFALIAKIPQSELAEAKAGIDQIEQGFRLGTGAPGREPMAPPRERVEQAGYSQTPQVGRPFVGIAIDQSRQAQGAVVGAVAPGGPAEQAGIRAGDVIVSIDRRPVTNAAAMPGTIGGSKPGETLEFGIVRDQQQSVVRVKVGTFPGR